MSEEGEQITDNQGENVLGRDSESRNSQAAVGECITSNKIKIH